ncbi:2-C-methyl-D-erythritol 4-phosphate cytidylyltransferase [Moraxella marmotae]|uniref:2-C-methyl-D-erythritol 4-phosphate cytidylyltransferase n=1 Tax=Moraxella marmotae TaxID=3344520 RepID=UPI0035F3921B
MKQPIIYPLIVAAGTGSRFGADKPKQYLSICGKTVLEHSIARLNHCKFDSLTLVLSADDAYADALMPKFRASFTGQIHHAIGGVERWQSVMNGLAIICELGGGDDDWVLIHDAARPCLPSADLDNLIAKIETGDDMQAVILATAVVDTLKYAKNHRIEHTVNREHLWQALTPQAFKIGTLKAAFRHVLDTKNPITDEASACEMVGVPVHIVPASRMNIKLTYADDLPLIQNILSGMTPSG